MLIRCVVSSSMTDGRTHTDRQQSTGSQGGAHHGKQFHGAAGYPLVKQVHANLAQARDAGLVGTGSAAPYV